jgi:hypothetical protein
VYSTHRIVRPQVTHAIVQSVARERLHNIHSGDWVREEQEVDSSEDILGRLLLVLRREAVVSAHVCCRNEYYQQQQEEGGGEEARVEA